MKPESEERVWISVKISLPPMELPVLVCRTMKDGKLPEVGEDCRRTRFKGQWGRTNGFQTVTHWMLLPSPPITTEEQNALAVFYGVDTKDELIAAASASHREASGQVATVSRYATRTREGRMKLNPPLITLIIPPP